MNVWNNERANFSVVTSLDVLESMGLTEGIDYAKVTAEVSDGETNPVEITVQKQLYWEDGPGILIPTAKIRNLLMT